MKKLIYLLVFLPCLFGFKNDLSTSPIKQNFTVQEQLLFVEQNAIRFKSTQWYAHLTDYEKKTVYMFFEDKRLNVLETAKMEELKYSIPASIIIAQAILETSWGRSVKDKNWFGIKGTGDTIITTEYLTKKQMKSVNIITKEKVSKNLFKCKIKDSFKEYKSDWDSWRHHSEYLLNAKNPRDRSELLYGDLFGKGYIDWAEGLQGRYATDPNYTNKILNIIHKYRLYDL